MLVETLTPGQCLALSDTLGDIYYQAFAKAPYHRTTADAQQFVLRIRRHMSYGGFRFLIVRTMPEMTPVGFAYGYRSDAGQGWHDAVAQAIGPVRATRLLSGALELAEFAVHPAYQRQGYGATLYDQLMNVSLEPRGVLSTATARTAALAFYRQRGWVTILPRMTFHTGGMAYRVMGLRREKSVESAAVNS